MAIINLEEQKIFYVGNVFYPAFDQLISFNTENEFITLRDSIKGERSMSYRFETKSLESYSPDLDTKEKLISYLYSVGMKNNLKDIPTSLENKLENKDGMYADLLGTLKAVNDGVRKVTYTKPAEGADTDGDVKSIVDEELEGMCCEVLISSGGRPNWEYIKKLKEEGFNVYPTEKDSFGWLGAAVKTNKGVIYFG